MKAIPQRVLITNCVALNGGDAAILYGLIDRLRAALGPGVEVMIVDDQPEAVRQRYPDLDARPRLDTTLRPGPNVRRVGRIVAELQRVRLLAGAWCIGHGLPELPRLWLNGAQRSALDAFRRADAVISTGGTYLVEHYHFRGRLLELEVALAMRRPLVLFTQSLGPFTREREREELRAILSRARLVLVRDERSRVHLDQIGIRGSRVKLVADAAFALCAPPAPAREGLRVAISVRHWPHGTGDATAVNEAYRDAMAALVERLVHRGAEVTFLSTCQGVPEYRADDSAVAAAVADQLDPTVRASVHVDRGFHDPQTLLSMLGGFDLVVATRMHMAILALVAGVPVFPIAYEFKTRELFARLGLGDWVHDFDRLVVPEFPDAVERLLDELPVLRPWLFARVAAERASSLSTASLLAQALVEDRRAEREAGHSRLLSKGTLRTVAERVGWQARYAGRGVQCPICGRSARRFAPHRDRPYAECPHCHSLERHRALWLWLRHRIPHGALVLHVAPEQGLAARLRALPIEYVSTDLESPLAMRHDDVTALPDPDGSFDVVICNHVLEHISDDRAAMRQIRRVLRPGGFAVLQHPIRAQAETFEDWTVVTPQDRLQVFGQEDHVRVYGRDFVDRLREAGFDEVDLMEVEDEIPAPLHARYGLRPSPTVIAR
jgi:colanic acid/amylovoran biosynthesis protein